MEKPKAVKEVKEPKLKRGFGGPWRVILTTIAIFLLSQILAAFIVGLIATISNPGHSTTELFNDSTLVQFFYVLIAEGMAAGLAIWMVRRRKMGLSAIGLGRRPSWRDLRWAGMGMIGFYALVIVASMILSLFVSQNELSKPQDIGFNNLAGTIAPILAFLSLVIIPPIGEEILVRGYLYSGLRTTMRFIPAMLVTSFMFGLAHLDGGIGGSIVWAAAVDTFILSIVLVFVRENTGALYAGILIHSTNNLIAYAVHFK